MTNFHAEKNDQKNDLRSSRAKNIEPQNIECRMSK